MKLTLIDSDPQGTPDRYMPSVVWDELVEAGEDPRHHAPLKWGFPRHGMFTVFRWGQPSERVYWLLDADARPALERFWGL